jgi:hypothetical protein
MDKEIEELQAWLQAAEKYGLPDYKELPKVPLYMEQVIGYVNDVLTPLNLAERKHLTSFMVNNYVKAKMIKEPDKKKYNEEHLGYLIAISLLKDTLSMSEISLLLELDKGVSEDKERLYSFFKKMQDDEFRDASKKLKGKTDSFYRHYQFEKNRHNPKAEENLGYSLGFLALHLAVESEVSQLLATKLLDVIAKNLYGEEGFRLENTPGHKEVKGELKVSAREARRLALIKREKEISEKKDRKASASAVAPSSTKLEGKE